MHFSECKEMVLRLSLWISLQLNQYCGKYNTAINLCFPHCKSILLLKTLILKPVELWYGHLVVTASLFCPGKTRKHFLIRKHINLATVLIWWMATFWNHNLYTNILFSTFNTSFWTNYVRLSISYIILHVLTEVFFYKLYLHF